MDKEKQFAEERKQIASEITVPSASESLESATDIARHPLRRVHRAARYAIEDPDDAYRMLAAAIKAAVPERPSPARTPEEQAWWDVYVAETYLHIGDVENWRTRMRQAAFRIYSV